MAAGGLLLSLVQTLKLWLPGGQVSQVGSPGSRVWKWGSCVHDLCRKRSQERFPHRQGQAGEAAKQRQSSDVSKPLSDPSGSAGTWIAPQGLSWCHWPQAHSHWPVGTFRRVTTPELSPGLVSQKSEFGLAARHLPQPSFQFTSYAKAAERK